MGLDLPGHWEDTPADKNLRILTEAANKRFGCELKAQSYINAPQPAFFGKTNNTMADQARLGNVQTTLHMLEIRGGC